MDPSASINVPSESASQRDRLTNKDVKIATWVCFFAWTFAVYDFVLFGNLLPELASDLKWTSAQATGINAWVTVGTALVAPLANVKRRRPRHHG